MRAIAAICAWEIVRVYLCGSERNECSISAALTDFFAVELCRKHSGMCAIILDLEDAIKKSGPDSGARRYGESGTTPSS